MQQYNGKIPGLLHCKSLETMPHLLLPVHAKHSIAGLDSIRTLFECPCATCMVHTTILPHGP